MSGLVSAHLLVALRLLTAGRNLMISGVLSHNLLSVIVVSAGRALDGSGGAGEVALVEAVLFVGREASQGRGRSILLHSCAASAKVLTELLQDLVSC